MADSIKFCPECGKEVVAKAVICPNCGIQLKPMGLGSGQNRLIAALLAFFVGFLGIHWFYIGEKKYGIPLLVYGLISLLVNIIIVIYPGIIIVDEYEYLYYNIIIYIILVLPYVISFINGIKFLTMNDDEFCEKYIKPNQ